ncbi:MAG: metallophosphoesterase family protein [Thermomicrobiales bacterium]
MPAHKVIDLPARIGLVADTHRRAGGAVHLPDELLAGLAGCDLILHAGDLNTWGVLDILGEIAPVEAVHGNNDEPDVVRALPETMYFTAGDISLGLLHGHKPGGTARQSAIQSMAGLVNCAVYGHSHIPDLSREGDLLLVNPGSPTQRRRSPHHSYAIMTIDREISVELVQMTR